MISSQLNITVLEEEDAQLQLLRQELDTLNASVQYTTTAKAFYEHLKKQEQDIIVCSYELSTTAPLEIFHFCKEHYPHTPFIIITETLDVNEAVDLMKAGVHDIIFKKDLSTLTNVLHTYEHSSTMLIDIPERNKAERQLLVSEERFKALVENGTDAVVILTADGKPLYISPSIERILGYTEEEAMQLDFFSLTHPDDIEGVATVWEEMLANPGVPMKVYTSRMLHKDGSWRWLEHTVTNMLHEPAINGVVDNFRDITEKVKADELIEFEKNNKEALINSTSDLIWTVSSDFKLIAANKAFLKKFHENIGVLLKPGDDLMMEDKFSIDFLNFWKEVYNRGLNGETFIKDIFFAANAPIKESWGEVSINPVYEGANITGVACYSRDITAYKSYENKLIDINKKLQTAQQIAHLGYWEVDLVTENLYWSDEVYKIWGVTSLNFEASSTNFFNSIHPDDKLSFDLHQKAALAGECKLDIEHRILLPNNTVKYVHELGELIYSEEGNPIRLEGTVQDITERKVAEEKLQLNQQQLNLIYNATTSIIFLIEVEADGRFKFISMNKAGLEAIGFTEEQILNQYVEDVIPPSSSPLVLSKYKEAVETNKTVVWEEETWYATGVKTGIVSVTPVCDENGRCIRLVGSVNDITERKLAEFKMYESEEKRSLIMNAALDAIICINTKGHITFWNPQAEKTFGWTEEEAMGQELTDVIIPAAFHASHTAGMKKYLASGHGPMLNKLLQLNAVNSQGVEFPIELTILPIMQGSEEFFCAFIRDITERKNAEESSRISNERYDLVAKATNDAIWDWDLNTGKVFRTGNGLKTLFGYDTAQASLNNHFWIDKVHPDDRDSMLSKRNDILEDVSKNLWEDEYRFLKADGHYAFVYDKGLVIRNAAGVAFRMIGSTQDITHLKETEVLLQKLNENLEKRARELQESNLELERFAYVASHDLQEPLRMVSSFLQLFEKKYKGNLDSTADQYIQFAVDGAFRMKKLIQDLLEYSRAGSIKEIEGVTDMNEVVKEVLAVFSERIEEQEAIVTTGPMPVLIHTRKTQLFQLMQNLVGNALKFHSTEKPFIQISAQENETHWIFTVQDNGIGFDKKYAEKIFVIFQRLHSKDAFSGTGIGLSICKKIAERHNGSIWVESETGKGTTFFFSIKK